MKIKDFNLTVENMIDIPDDKIIFEFRCGITKDGKKYIRECVDEYIEGFYPGDMIPNHGYCWRNQIRDDNGFMDFLCSNINKPNDVDLITDFLCDHVFVIKAKYLKDKLKERREFGHCDHLDYSDIPYIVNRGFKDIMGCYPGPHRVEWRCPYVNDEEFHRSTGSIC